MSPSRLTLAALVCCTCLHLSPFAQLAPDPIGTLLSRMTLEEKAGQLTQRG